MFLGGVKKVVTIILIITIIISNIPIFAEVNPSRNYFIDIKGHYAENVINEWSNRAFISGYPDGTYLPDSQITRAEFVSIMTKVFEFNASQSNENLFTDVNQKDWYFDSIMLAANHGVISGDQNQFKPQSFITREDASVIISRYLELTKVYDKRYENEFIDGNKISTYAISHVAAMAEMEFVKGFPLGTFRPQRFLSRAEAIILFDNIYKSIYGSSGISGRIYSDSKILQNANIFITRQGEHKITAELKSDSNGDFKIDLKPGIYDFVVNSENKVNYYSNIEVKIDKYTIVKSNLEEGQTVTGILKYSDGTLVSNEDIAIKTNPYFFTKTNLKGEFSVVLPKNREYTIYKLNSGEFVQIGNFSTNDKSSNLVINKFIVNKFSNTNLGSESNNTSPSINYFTKGEWVKWLMEKLEITPILSNVDHEFFFSDVSTNPNGRTIETANTLGMLPSPKVEDYESSNSSAPLFHPNEKATREFVAFTLAKALGFYGDYTIHTNDANDISYLSEVAVIVKNGLITLNNGSFLPLVGITSSDVSVINKKINELNESVNFSEDEFIDQVTYDDDVLVLNEDNYSIVDAGNDIYTVNIAKNNNTVKIVNGTIFILPPNDDYISGISLKANDIVDTGDQYQIICSIPDIEDVVDEVQFIGVGQADISNLSVAEGVIAEYNPNGVIVQNNEQLAPFEINENVSFPGTLEYEFFEKEIGNTGITVNGNIEIAMPTISAKVKGKVFTGFELEEITATIQRTITVSSSVKYDFGVKDFDISDLNAPPKLGQGQIELGKVPFVLGTTGLTLDVVLFLNVEIGGEITVGFEIEGLEGLQYKNGTFRLINEYDFDMNDIEINATALIGIGIEVRISLLSTFDLIGVEAQVGAAVKVKFEKVEGYEKDVFCGDGSYYIYLKVGIDDESIIGDVVGYNLSYDIWDEETSPFDSDFHIENGPIVSSCSVKLGSVSGKVDDLETGEPLSDVEISVYNKYRNALKVVDVSNTYGEYSILDLPAGIYEFRFSKENYVGQSIDFVVIGNKVNKLPNVELIKIEENDEDVVDGKLEVVLKSTLDESIISGYDYELISNESTPITDSVLAGRCENLLLDLSIAPGNYTLLINKQGYLSTQQNVSIQSDLISRLEILITPEVIVEPEEPVYSNLSGRIIIKEPLDVPQSNISVSGVDVKITNKNTLEQLSVQTDENGEYLFEDIITGTYLIEANHNEYYTYSSEVSISDENPVIKDLGLIRLGTKKFTDFIQLYFEWAYLGLDNYGDSYVWGENYTGIGVHSDSMYINNPTIVPKLGNIKQVASYYSATMAVDVDGNLWQWGDYTIGKRFETILGDGSNRSLILSPTLNTNISNVKKVIINDMNSIVLKNDGTLWYSGYVVFSGDGEADTSDETVNTFTRVNRLTNIVDIFGGIQSYFAIDTENRLWSVGHYTENGHGIPEGNVFAENEEIPKIILSNVKNVGSGTGKLKAALTYDGSLYAWGYHFSDGNDLKSQYVPKLLISDISQFIVFDNCIIALKNDGTVWGWGDDWPIGTFGLGSTADVLIEPTQIWTEFNGIEHIYSLNYGALIEMFDGKFYVIGQVPFDVTGNGLENQESILVPTLWEYILVE